MKNLLEIKSLNTYYGESHILRDVDLNVQSGEMVCLIGRNGVGKTTLLKSLIGLLKQKKGDIYLIGENINRKAPHQRARKGMAYVPQGREIIPYLSVEENLMLGMESLPGGLSKNKKIDPFVYDFDNVIAKDKEKDTEVYGLPTMHEVRKKVNKISKPYTEVLSAEVINKYINYDFWNQQ